MCKVDQADTPDAHHATRAQGKPPDTPRRKGSCDRCGGCRLGATATGMMEEMTQQDRVET